MALEVKIFSKFKSIDYKYILLWFSFLYHYFTTIYDTFSIAKTSSYPYLFPPGRLKPVPAPTSSALMHSDSDLESDDGQAGIPWSDRERGKLLPPQNGALRNGQGPHKPKKLREELL